MAGPDEERWLPRFTSAVGRAVSWFLGRIRDTGQEAAEAAARGQAPDIADGAPTADEFDATLYGNLEPELQGAFGEAYAETAQQAPGDAEQVLKSEAEYAAEYLRQVHDRLSQTLWPEHTYNTIRDTLAQAAAEQWPLDQIREALRELLDPDTYDWWIDRVAVTELHSAWNAGTAAAAEAEQAAFGQPVTLTWIATNDERTRHDHREADGQQVQAGTPFVVGGSPLRWPGDPLGPPSQTINCRCTLGVAWPDTSAPAPDTTEPEPEPEPELEGGDVPVTGDDVPDVVDDAATWEERPDLAPAQSAFRYYTGGAYERINNTLRRVRNAKMNAQDKKAAAAMRRAYPHLTPSTAPVRLVRTVSNVEELFGTSNLDEIIGSTLDDKAFVSASTKPGRFKGGKVTLVITADAGSRLPYIAPVSDKPAEEEVTLGPGTQLLITGGDQGKKGRIVLYAKLIGGPSWNGKSDPTTASLRPPRTSSSTLGSRTGSTATPTTTAPCTSTAAAPPTSSPAPTAPSTPSSTASASPSNPHPAPPRSAPATGRGAASACPDTVLQEDAMTTATACACSAQPTAITAADPLPPTDDSGSPTPWDGLKVSADLGGEMWEQTFTADSVTTQRGDGPKETAPLDKAEGDDGGYEFTFTLEDGTQVEEDVNESAGTVKVKLTDQDGTETELSGKTADAKAKDEPEDSKSSAPKKGVNPFAQKAAVSASVGQPATSRTAAPADWFTDPQLTAATPLTVTDDGRVYGHLASWKQPDGTQTCHTGSPKGQCIEPPRSASDYRYFTVGEYRTADGRGVAVGNLVVDTDHANMTADAVRAAAHYADTGAAVAAVRAGEDAHGIWVAGTLLPDVSDKQIATLRRAPLSGDWRSIGGRLELVAALAVNVPGFPVPRPAATTDDYARVASLTAAGVLPPADDSPLTADAVADTVIARLDDREKTRARNALAASLGDKAASYAARVRRERVAALAGRATPRARRAARTAAATADESDESHRADDGTHLTADDVQTIADLLGIDADQVQAVTLTDEETAEITALLDEEDDAGGGGVTAANWVSRAGGLPKIVKRISKHLRRKGMTESHAIATAINAVKKGCASGDVNWPGIQNMNAASRARYCKGMAEWEALKARNKAKKAVT